MNEKEVPHNLIKQDLPEWFCLIQTNREYYIERYADLQQGKNKINYATFFSLIFPSFLAVPLHLLYRKFLIIPILVVWGIAIALFCLYDLALHLSIRYLIIFFKFNVFYYVIPDVSFFIFCIIASSYFVSLKYNAWYFKSVRKKYEAGYRPSFYKDTFSSWRCLLFLNIFMNVIYGIQFINDRIKLNRHLKDVKKPAN
ncbi:MAG: hypothetical protein CNLJKLNK_01207 [Holosporales bacterium]